LIILRLESLYHHLKGNLTILHKAVGLFLLSLPAFSLIILESPQVLLSE
jgi:hypothetical protein